MLQPCPSCVKVVSRIIQHNGKCGCFECVFGKRAFKKKMKKHKRWFKK